MTHQNRARGQAVKTNLLGDSISELQFERVTIKPKGSMLGTPHSRGTKEYFTCAYGHMLVFVESQSYLLEKEDVFSLSWRVQTLIS